MAPELADLGRFSEPALLILASLAGGAKHGYAIEKDVQQFSGVRLNRAPSTAPSPDSRAGAGSSRCRPRSVAARTGHTASARRCCGRGSKASRGSP